MQFRISFQPGLLTIIAPDQQKHAIRVQTAEQAHTWLSKNGYKVLRVTGDNGVTGVYAHGINVA